MDSYLEVFEDKTIDDLIVSQVELEWFLTELKELKEENQFLILFKN